MPGAIAEGQNRSHSVMEHINLFILRLNKNQCTLQLKKTANIIYVIASTPRTSPSVMALTRH